MHLKVNPWEISKNNAEKMRAHIDLEEGHRLFWEKVLLNQYCLKRNSVHYEMGSDKVASSTDELIENRYLAVNCCALLIRNY
jgi:hypothetical protein